jgi:hypothetical protein
MKYYILFAVLGLFSLSFVKVKRSERLLLAQVRQGQYLDKATQLSVQGFFERRMSNKEYNKVCAQTCDLIYENDSFIYCTYTCGELAYGLFKVQRKLLEDKFPGYKAIEGYHAGNAAEKFFARDYPRGPKWYATDKTYRDNGILVKLRCDISSPVWYNQDRTKTITDSLLLSKTDLSIIQ